MSRYLEPCVVCFMFNVKACLSECGMFVRFVYFPCDPATTCIWKIGICISTETCHFCINATYDNKGTVDINILARLNFS